ncbi:MAG: hypothetical protein M3R44_05880 [Candidatus Eremiobacteraeota bacterium]|nr:hypothetical protein [Candidatus Eremiobacteraeota bacterium]
MAADGHQSGWVAAGSRDFGFNVVGLAFNLPALRRMTEIEPLTSVLANAATYVKRCILEHTYTLITGLHDAGVDFVVVGMVAGQITDHG